MTRRKLDDDLTEAEVAEALRSRDLLIPETPDEVRRVEEAIDEDAVELPAGLRSFSAGRRKSAREETSQKREKSPVALRADEAEEPSTPTDATPERAVAEVRRLRTARVWAFAGTLAAAAAIAFVWLSRSPPTVETPPIGGAQDELQVPPPAPPKKMRLDLSADCRECCAGAQCADANDDLRTCPSGRDCVACETPSGKNAYKIRVSALGLSDAGLAWAKRDGRDLSTLKICATAHGTSLGCRSATEDPSDLLDWISLPAATTSSQLLGGVRVTLESADQSAVASWQSAVHVGPETLCRGVAARLTTPTGEAIGRVSVFFDDAYFVELARAATVTALLEKQEQFLFDGGAPALYETSADGNRRFALVLGPTTRRQAEKLRWQLLDQDFDAPITFGEDHRGRPRPR